MINCQFENGNKDNLRHVTVTVMIVVDNKILLGKRGTFKGKKLLEHGKWDTIGGFLDRDEDTRGCAKREVFEETGLKITSLKLFRINDSPYRPFEDRQNVEFVYFAKVEDENRIANEEVSELKWFDLDNLPPAEKIAFDHFESIELYMKYLKEKFKLPVY